MIRHEVARGARHDGNRIWHPHLRVRAHRVGQTGPRTRGGGELLRAAGEHSRVRGPSLGARVGVEARLAAVVGGHAGRASARARGGPSFGACVERRWGGTGRRRAGGEPKVIRAGNKLDSTIMRHYYEATAAMQICDTYKWLTCHACLLQLACSLRKTEQRSCRSPRTQPEPRQQQERW